MKRAIMQAPVPEMPPRGPRRGNNPQVFLEDFEWFNTLSYASIFKRGQVPPIPSTTANSFGQDFFETMIPIVDTAEAVAHKLALRNRNALYTPGYNDLPKRDWRENSRRYRIRGSMAVGSSA